MVDYNKLTKPDLEAQLKERSLPHTGKKADLVARLQEDDAKKAAAAPATSEPEKAKEDEIDWEEEAPKATPAPPAPAQSNEPKTAAVPVNATVQPTEIKAAEAVPSTTDQPAEDQAEREKTPKDFSLGLAKLSVQEELDKVIARAKKFGTQDDTATKENIAKLERALKFGEEDGLSVLNGALPERSRKRGGDHRDDGRVNKRRGQGGQGGRVGGGRGRGPRRDGGGGGGQRREQGSGNGSGAPGWMSQKDKEASEARKRRFAGES